MTIAKQAAAALRSLYFGGNWTDVNFKDVLSGVDWLQANREIYSLNSIVSLVYHTNYYLLAVTEVLRGNPLNAHDQDSFDHPQALSELDWKNTLDKTWNDVHSLADLTEELPEEKFDQIFSEIKYGNCHRNIYGLIEHGHYHLGQIVLIKKMLSQV